MHTIYHPSTNNLPIPCQITSGTGEAEQDTNNVASSVRRVAFILPENT